MNIELFSSIKCPKCDHLHFAPKCEHIPAVKCNVCGKLHAQGGESYVAVQGNVTIGMKGGLIGNNIENDVVTKVSIFCKGECFKSVCSSALSEDTKEPARAKIVKCPKGGTLGEDFVECGRKPDCSEKQYDAYKICLELSE